MRWVFAAAAGFLAFFGRERPSSAQSQDWGNVGPLIPPEGVALTVAGLVTVTSGVTFAIAEGVCASQDGWMPPLWAKLQLALAAAPITIAGGTGLALSLKNDSELVVPSLMFTTIGGWFLTHSVLSFNYYEPKPSGERRSSPSLRAKVAVVPMPSGGEGVVVVGQF